MMTGTPRRDVSQVSITPEMVLEMCHTLDIVMDGTTPEFYMLWLPVEALTAPLPPLWALRTEGGEGGAPPTTFYEHSVSKQRLAHHPLLSVYKEQALKPTLHP